MSKTKGKVTAKHVEEELSSDNSSDEVVVTKTKKTAKAVKKVQVEEPSSDEEPKFIAKKTKAVKGQAVASPKKAPVLQKAKKVAKQEDSDEESSEEQVVSKKVAAKKPVKKAPVAESDSDEDESEEEVVVKKAPATNGHKKEESSGEGHNELFVRNLGYSTTEDGLWTYFGTYGTVTKVKILTNREDGRSKGIGFVEFSSNAEAKAALDDAANLSLDGRELQVNYSGQKPTNNASAGGYGEKQGGYGGGQQGGYGASTGGDKHTCFIRNISYNTTEDGIKSYFGDCGGIVAVRIAKDRDTGKIKGFAHVDFEAPEGVNNAIAKNGGELDGREIRIEASAPKEGGSSGGRGGYGGGRGGGRGGYGGGRGRGGY